EDDWNTFTEIWRKLSKGIQLEEGPETVVINGRRMTRGSYSNGWPGIFATVDALLGDAIPRTLLTDWYRSDLCSRYQIIDSQEFIVFAEEWIDRFNRINARRYKREDLITLISSREISHKREWAEGLVEALDFLALVNFDAS